jgi:purine-binding chemotaxis protein CheW
VTAVNMRQRLNLAKSDFPEKAMAVVVEYEDEPYSLLVDEVGEVLRLPNSQRDNNPATLDAKWRQIADGLYRLDGSLLIVLNIAAVLGAIRAEA